MAANRMANVKILPSRFIEALSGRERRGPWHASLRRL
jgi:hypothetical protein